MFFFFFCPNRFRSLQFLFDLVPDEEQEGVQGFLKYLYSSWHKFSNDVLNTSFDLSSKVNFVHSIGRISIFIVKLELDRKFDGTFVVSNPRNIYFDSSSNVFLYTYLKFPMLMDLIRGPRWQGGLLDPGEKLDFRGPVFVRLCMKSSAHKISG